MAQTYGISIDEKSQSAIELKLPNGRKQEYQIKYSFPFKSETKRMGILLKDTAKDEYIFYLKGADIVMKDLVVGNHNKGFI